MFINRFISSGKRNKIRFTTDKQTQCNKNTPT